MLCPYLYVWATCRVRSVPTRCRSWHDSSAGSISVCPQIFLAHTWCVQVDSELFRDESVSFIGSLPHCFPRVSIYPDACRSPNSKIDEYRSACAYGWPRIVARRHRVTDTSIEIERSNRLTTARLVWCVHSSCPVWLIADLIKTFMLISFGGNE